MKEILQRMGGEGEENPPDLCSSLNIWELKIFTLRTAKSFLISFVGATLDSEQKEIKQAL